MIAAATHQERLDHVKTNLRDVLSRNAYFLSLPKTEQLELYKEMLSSGVRALEDTAAGRSRAASAPYARAFAGDLDPTRIAEVGAIAGDFLDEIDFPQFVRDLVLGIYNTLVDSNIKQMMSYTEFFKALSKPLGALAQQISNADAIGQIASNDPLRFTMMPPSGPSGEPGLRDNDTNMTLDTSNDEVQKMMFQAKLELARERRLLLRETLLMGVQRLVIDQGTIRATMNFRVQAVENFQGANRTTDISQSGGGFGGGVGFLAGPVGGLLGGGYESKRTKISVSTRALQTNTQLDAQITGFVELKFSTDRFNLNNFASLFGDESTNREITQRQAQTAPPAGAPPPPRPAPAPVPVAPGR